MFKSPYRLVRPDERSTSVFFASPHSCSEYPWGFLSRTMLDERTIRSSEDAFVDILLSDAPAFGAPVLLAGAPRAYVDVNRGSDELDPALIENVERGVHNPRVASGLGVIPRVVANGRAIYRGKISRAEAARRIEGYWRPYHDALAELFGESHALFGEAILVDVHSMPHEAIEGLGQDRCPRPEIVIGDRFGAAAGSQVVEAVESAFAEAGFRVARNAPFAGAYVTQHYGRPSRGQHVVQVEIDRALYMNEARIEPHAGFDTFRATLSEVLGRIAGLGRARAPLAAE